MTTTQKVKDTGSGEQTVQTTPGFPVVQNATTTTIATQNSTPTAAQLLGGIIDHVSVTGAGTATLDTAANLDAAFPSAVAGDSFTCLYANTGSQTVTITTNTGLTLKGTAALATLKNALLTFYKTGAAAWRVYITGGA